MPKKVDMTKMPPVQRRKADRVEQDLKKRGTRPRQAEQEAWNTVGERSEGKRRSGWNRSAGRSKAKSSSTPKSRKTHAGRGK